MKVHGIVRYLCPYQSRSQYPHQCTSQSQRLRRWRPQHCLCCHHPALCCRLLPQVGKALMQSQSQHKYRIQSEAFACASNARQRRHAACMPFELKMYDRDLECPTVEV